MPNALAIAHACWPPAPPKQASAWREVSYPLAWNDTECNNIRFTRILMQNLEFLRKSSRNISYLLVIVCELWTDDHTSIFIIIIWQKRKSNKLFKDKDNSKLIVIKFHTLTFKIGQIWDWILYNTTILSENIIWTDKHLHLEKHQ